MSSKLCSCCKEVKDLSLFSKNKSRKDGLHPSCKKCKNKGNQKYHSNNREKEAKYSKQYYETIGKFQTAKIRARAAKRRATRIQATPKWLNISQLLAINYKYSVATMLTKSNNEAYVVDHIVPLQGKTVCGLHVPWNLQVMLAVDNLKKSNKFYGDSVNAS